MSKKIFSIKTLLAFCAVVCLTIAAGFMSMPKQATAKADGGNTYLSEIKQVEYFTNQDLLLVHLSNTDYMTAEEWSAPYDYKWVASLTLENKTTANVHNAVLDKNLSGYNLPLPAPALIYVMFCMVDYFILRFFNIMCLGYLSPSEFLTAGSIVPSDN